MKFQQLLLSAFAGLTSAQSLSDALASQNSSLSLLNSLLASRPDLLQSLNSTQNITVLAPNNNALNTFLNNSALVAQSSDPNIIDAILNYHVLQGVSYLSMFTNMTMFIPTLLNNQTYSNVTGGQRVESTSDSNGNITFISGMLSNSTLVTPNVNFTGGTIHIVDSVLTIPTNDTITALATDLTAFVGGLNLSGMTSNVTSSPDVTIFAPSNAAFEAIGSLAGNLSAQDLGNILDYHVVPGSIIYSTGFANGTLRAANGEEIHVEVANNGDVFVNSAKITQPDVLVSNGVLHIVDNVLNPQNTTAAPNPTATAGAPAFTGATSAVEVPFTTGISATTTIAATGISTGTASAVSSSSSSAPAAPMRTAAVGAVALFGGAAMLVNL